MTDMNVNEITQLIERFDSSKATKLQFKTGDIELLLENTSAQIVASSIQVEQGWEPENESERTVAATPKKPVTINAVTPKTDKMARVEISGTPVKAPLIGTFYCAPSPDEKAFVEVGQSVKQGDVVGIIEAMKLMNEITAPADGVVKCIYAENGRMVEYGEVLMVLE